MSTGLQPNSRASQALKALSAQDGCTTRDYLRILKQVGGDRHDVVANDLMTRGFVERRVMLTDKGRAALGLES